MLVPRGFGMQFAAEALKGSTNDLRKGASIYDVRAKGVGAQIPQIERTISKKNFGAASYRDAKPSASQSEVLRFDPRCPSQCLLVSLLNETRAISWE